MPGKSLVLARGRRKGKGAVSKSTMGREQSVAQYLPTEILLRILRHLSLLSFNRKSLRAATLICRAWTPAANEVLYRTIEMTSNKASRLLLQTLTDNPALSNHIRKFIVPFVHSTYFPGSPWRTQLLSVIGRDRVPRPARMSSNDYDDLVNLMNKIMGCCNRLVSIHAPFQADSAGIGLPALFEVTPELRENLKTMVLRKTFCYPAFMEMSPWKEIDLPNLERLTLEGVYIDVWSWPHAPSKFQGTFMPKLRHLTLNNCTMEQGPLKSLIIASRSSLHSLTIKNSRFIESEQEIRRYPFFHPSSDFAPIAPTLKHLCVDHVFEFRQKPHPLVYLTGLETLEIQISGIYPPITSPLPLNIHTLIIRYTKSWCPADSPFNVVWGVSMLLDIMPPGPSSTGLRRIKLFWPLKRNDLEIWRILAFLLKDKCAKRGIELLIELHPVRPKIKEPKTERYRLNRWSRPEKPIYRIMDSALRKIGR
ncbi:hypothetical protein SISSUDRAFT_256588 [Sistotremastrum suecicum HHB10207 ss-3]|uniref:F-box domain-containing protein n=1 Tax=Sistotremastrum suecicum HHB10207 ss-3 TaxID=1314776 RepID=A0A166GCI6_9AGAM|nr:hypothetical protein SISSUDRAFT_256588 [Sistotremastrum suecicum HHB10207 ss-3]